MLQRRTDDLEVQRRERWVRKGGYVIGFMKEVAVEWGIEVWGKALLKGQPVE